MKIVSVINWKGGVGKTTITHHIACALQELSLSEINDLIGIDHIPSVLLIDLDPQCSLSISALSEDGFETKLKNLKTVKDVFYASMEGKLDSEDIDSYILKKSVRASPDQVYTNIDLLPSHPDLIYTDMDIADYSKPNYKNNLLNSGLYKFQMIDEMIKKIKKEYDFVFFDCPPNLNFITQNALYKSDYYLIPTILDKLSTYGIVSINNKVENLNKTFSNAAKSYINTKLIGIVANNVRDYGGAPKWSQTIVKSRLTSTFPDMVFDNYLTNGDGIAQASDRAFPVFALETSLANASKQSESMREITREFLTRL